MNKRMHNLEISVRKLTKDYNLLLSVLGPHDTERLRQLNYADELEKELNHHKGNVK